ncbi:MAG: hypothetical protein V4687_16130 [Bacteroidota bacterium]
MNLRFTLSNPILGAEVLEYSPKGWEDLTINLVRDPEYHGVSMDIPTTLLFHCKAGRQYWLDAYNQLGIDAEVKVTIDRCCGNRPVNEGSEDYSDDYSDDYGSSLSSLGYCEWSPFIEGIGQIKDIKVDPDFVTVPLIQSTEHQKFKNRIDNTVSLSDPESLDGDPVDTLEPMDFTLHNKGIVLVSKLYISDDVNFVDYSADIVAPPPVQTSLSSTVPFLLLEENFIQTAFDVGININNNPNALTVIYKNETPFFVERGVSFRVKYELNDWVCDPTEPRPNITNLIIAKYITTYTEDFTILDTVNLCGGGSNLRDVTYDQILTFEPDEKLVLFVNNVWGDGTETVPSTALPPTITYDIEACYFNIKGELPYAETITKAFGLHECGALISQRVLSKNDAFYSDTFGRKDAWPTPYSENGCDSFGVLFSGLNARAFPYEDNPLRLSLKSLYQGLNPIYNLGMGLKKLAGEYVVTMESKKTFYNDEVLFRLVNVPNIVTTLLQDYFMNEFRIGYDKWESEEVSGIDEFNTKRYYNTGLKGIQNIIEKFSIFIASGYSIQLTRQKQWKNDNTNEDYKTDNENFIVCTNRSVDSAGFPDQMDIAEKDENYDDVTGIYSPQTSYNLRISPERNKIRHNGIIAPALLKYPGRVLKFTYGEGNYEASYRGTDDCDVYGNEVLAGNQNVAWDDPNIILFLSIWNPIVDEFIFPLSADQIESMLNNQYGLIQFGKDEEEIIEGWILDVKPKIQGGLTSFKLLRKYRA